MSSEIPKQITYAAILGRVLQGHREAAKLTQGQVAALLGMTQPGYSKIEQGDTAVSVLQLRQITQALRVDPGLVMHQCEGWITHLNAQGVTVVSQKEATKAALLVGLGVLAGLVAIGSAASR